MIKYLLLIPFLTGCICEMPRSDVLGAVKTEADLIREQEALEDVYYQTYGKYEQKLPQKSGKYDVIVNVYETPEGQGRQVMIIEEVEGGRWIAAKAEGGGKIAEESKTFKWFQPENDI